MHLSLNEHQLAGAQALQPTRLTFIAGTSHASDHREVFDLYQDVGLSSRRILGFFVLALFAALAVTITLAFSAGTAHAVPVSQAMTAKAMAAKADDCIAIVAALSVLGAAFTGAALAFRHLLPSVQLQRSTRSR